MNRDISKIAQIIVESGGSEAGQGLLHGNSGLSLFLYLLSQKTGNTEYREKAEGLLDKVFLNLNTGISGDFESGLSGIGWAVEYLIQNKLIEGDPDDVLEEVDNRVFKLLNEESTNSFELTNGLTGYLHYLILRLQNKPRPFSMAWGINRELFILVINKIYETVTIQFPGIVKELQFDLYWRFPLMLHGLKVAFELDIYSEKIKCIYKQWLPNIEAYIPSMNINRLYLATVLMQICSQAPDPRLKKQIKILLYGTDFNMIPNEVDPKQLNFRFGWPGFIFVSKIAERILPPDVPNYQCIKESADMIWDEHHRSLANINISDFPIKSRALGISEGIAGLGLFSLFISGYQINKQLLPISAD